MSSFDPTVNSAKGIPSLTRPVHWASPRFLPAPLHTAHREALATYHPRGLHRRSLDQLRLVPAAPARTGLPGQDAERVAGAILLEDKGWGTYTTPKPNTAGRDCEGHAANRH